MSSDILVVNYSYFANGWLRDVKRGTSAVASYAYDQVGNRTRVNFGNSTYQTYTYNPTDPRYQLDKIDYAYRCGTGQPVAVQGSICLTRDNSGNPLTWSALDMSTPQKKIYSKAYSYDQMSRLDSANYPGKGTNDFLYDWVGNRTSPGNMEYNASDQLTRWPGQHRYEYDGRGNLICEKSDSGTTQKTYAYTYSNLTSSITYSGVNKSSLMSWDASGNRITFQSSRRAAWLLYAHPRPEYQDDATRIEAVRRREWEVCAEGYNKQSSMECISLCGRFASILD